MAKDPLYYKLIEACEQPGCLVCRVTVALVDRYLDAMFYENVNDIPTRAHLRQSLGFCQAHAWRLMEGQAGNALGIAIIYQDVLINVLRGLPDHGTPAPKVSGRNQLFERMKRQLSDRVKNVLQAITPAKECPACQERTLVTQLTLDIFLNELGDERLITAFTQSDGLCLPHLRLAIEQNRSEADLAPLLALARARISELQEDLSEFVRKNDYRFKDEAFGKESSSWRKAIGITNGERDS